MSKQATFSNGAAQSAPDAVNGAVDGAKDAVNGKAFHERVASIPIVSDTLNQAYNAIQSNTYTSAAYAKAESVATSVYSTIAPPVQKNLSGPLATADSYANKALDAVEKRLPIAFEPTGEVIAKARKPADDAVALAQARLGPYTGTIQHQLQAAQSNLHTVQEKLAGVVASLPRSPKEVQTSAHEIAHSLLAEVEKIRDSVTASAKELPANVQSTIHTLSEQLQHAASDIRAELNRTDIPLASRAVNVLTYSRDNTEKVIRDALDRVSQLLSSKRNGAAADAEGAAKDAAGAVQSGADQAAATAKDAAGEAQKQAKGAAGEAQKQAKAAQKKAGAA